MTPWHLYHTVLPSSHGTCVIQYRDCVMAHVRYIVTTYCFIVYMSCLGRVCTRRPSTRYLTLSQAHDIAPTTHGVTSTPGYGIQKLTAKGSWGIASGCGSTVGRLDTARWIGGSMPVRVRYMRYTWLSRGFKSPLASPLPETRGSLHISICNAVAWPWQYMTRMQMFHAVREC